MKFDRCGDVKLYLVGSIVIYNSKPVQVTEAQEVGGGKFQIGLKYLTIEAIPFTTTTEDPLLELDPPTLGYYNAGGKAIYLQREPVRHYKRGLSGENVRNAHFSTKAVLAISQHRYPSLSTAADSVKNNIVESCAFSCNFAIDDKFLYFKKRRVGVNKRFGVVLDKKFLFLNKKLQESVNG